MDQRPPSEYYYGPPGNPCLPPQYMPIPGPYPPRHLGHPFDEFPGPPCVFTPGPLNSERVSPQEPPAGTSATKYYKSMVNERRKKRNRDAQRKARQKQKKLIEDLNSQLVQTNREKAQLKAQVKEMQQQIRVLLSSNNPGHYQTDPYN